MVKVTSNSKTQKKHNCGPCLGLDLKMYSVSHSGLQGKSMTQVLSFSPLNLKFKLCCVHCTLDSKLNCLLVFAPLLTANTYQQPMIYLETKLDYKFVLIAYLIFYVQTKKFNYWLMFFEFFFPVWGWKFWPANLHCPLSLLQYSSPY